MDGTKETRETQEQGFVLLAMVLTCLPLMVVVGAFSSTMVRQSSEIEMELARERALLAAESGIDDAIFRGQTGQLYSGTDYKRELPGGLGFSVEPTHLLYDGVDNDADGFVDESDEDVFQVVATGHYRYMQRRLAAYLGPVPLLPPVTSSVTLLNPNPSLDLRGTALLSGFDRDMDGTLAGDAAPAIAIAPPGDPADVEAELNGSEETQVVGEGGAPSIGTAAAIDLPTLVQQLQNAADLVLTSDRYSAYDFGNGEEDVAHVAYREGDVRFGGNTRGAGVLVVTGDLRLGGTFRFDGVIIVLGSVYNSAGTVDIYGGIIQGPSGEIFDLRGTFQAHFSTEAVAMASKVSGRYVAFSGWQEIAR